MSFQTQSPTQTNLNLNFLLEEIKILTQENSRLARDNKELATRILRMAKWFATECAAIFDLCEALQLIEEKYYVQCRELLLRIVSMLIKMAQRPYQIQSGTGTHTGTGTKLTTP